MIDTFTTTIELHGETEHDVEVEFDYTRGEMQTYDHPGCDPEVTIISVKCGEIELIDELDDSDITRLEIEAFDHVHEQYIQEAEDRAEYIRDLNSGDY